MTRLWVVECQFNDGQWDICDFGSYPFAFTNFYEGHRIKKLIQKHLKKEGTNYWKKKRFRVREYKPTERRK